MNKAIVISEDPVKIRKKLEESMTDPINRQNSVQLRASLDKRVAGAIEEVLNGFNSGASKVSMQSGFKSQAQREDNASRNSRGSLRKVLNRSTDKNDYANPGKVSTRLYQTPGKENRPVTIIAQKPQTKSGSKSLVVTETKIVAKLRNKDNRFKEKLLNTQTRNDRMREYSEA